MQKHLVNWLSVLLLVLGQAMLLAHQVDIDAHQGHIEDCAICHLAHALDQVVTAGNPLSLAVLSPDTPENLKSLSFACATFYHSRSRAPPAPLA